MKAKLNYKAAFLIILVILINAAVIIATSLLWRYFNSEEKRAEKFLSGRGISTDELGEMKFEFESEYSFKDGETRKIKGTEVYYWNGRKFVPASEFLKGYDD